MTKTPIYFKDIRPGDTVERELLGTVLRMPVARIADALAYSPENYCVGDEYDAAWFLLDRPKPPVDLPTEPTLGWLTASESRGRRTPPDRELAVWSLHQDPDVSIQRNGGNCGIAARWVTAFTPATAVPTEALDRFRHLRDTRNLANSDVDTFLAAIDEANA